MTKVLGRLALIALVVFVGVTLWYGQMEKKLQPPVAAESGQPGPTAAPVAAPTAEPVPASQEHSVIVRRNIFQALPELGAKPGGAAPVELEKLAETKMQLVLLGTVTGSEADARAIIRDDQAKVEDIYRVGSTLAGAAITRIGRGKVVLLVNGREEILTIKEPESGGPQSRPSPAAAGPAAVQADPVSERPVPEALPRRRISFRSPAPASPVAPPPGATASEEAAVAPAPPDQEQGTPADNQPPAETGAPPPETGPASGGEQQAQ